MYFQKSAQGEYGVRHVGGIDKRATTKLSAVQRRILQAIQDNPRDWSGQQSNSHEGRTIQRLLQLGLIEAASETYEPEARTPYGRKLPGFIAWGQLTLTPAGEAALNRQRQANPGWWRSDESDDPTKLFWTDPNDEIQVQDVLDEFDQLIDIQLSPGNWDFDPYLFGMANGMLLMRSIISGEDPEYLEAPEQWGQDRWDAEETELECSAGFRDGVRLARDISGDHNG